MQIIGSEYPLIQLETTKSSNEDLFKDLLYKTKDFKYQIIVQVLLSKHKGNGDIEFSPVYLNFTTKTVINDN